MSGKKLKLGFSFREKYKMSLLSQYSGNRTNTTQGIFLKNRPLVINRWPTKGMNWRGETVMEKKEGTRKQRIHLPKHTEGHALESAGDSLCRAQWRTFMQQTP